MATSVQSQVVGAGEGAVAVFTLERLDPGVLTQMPRQFVGPSEAPSTVTVRTLKRLFAYTPYSKKSTVVRQKK